MTSSAVATMSGIMLGAVLRSEPDSIGLPQFIELAGETNRTFFDLTR